MSEFQHFSPFIRFISIFVVTLQSPLGRFALSMTKRLKYSY